MSEPALTLTGGEVAAASGGRVVAGDPSAAFGVFGIDSRAIVAGQLFVAIAGERHDGHAFLGEAVDKGARGVVVAGGRGASLRDRRPAPVVIEVEDTTVALQRMGRAMRRKSGARLVAITGSAGKTTTKEVAAAFLALRHRTFRNRGNLNNHIGLPLSLLELGRGEAVPEMAVLELGMSAPGEIRTLVDIAEPDVRVWTNVAEAHLEHFPSVAAIADAKAEILEGAQPDSVLVANGGDALVMARAARFAGRTVTFDLDRRADVSATDIESRGVRGMAATVATAAGSVRLETPLVGRGNLANVLAGLAADAVRHAATSDEAAEIVAGLVRAGDLVLVKGSRGVRLERVVDRLAEAGR